MFSPEWLNVYLAVAALVLAALIYFAGVQRGRQYRQEDAIHRREEADRKRAQARIDGVVDEYCRLYHANYTGGLHGLLLAGAKNLESERDVRTAVETIRARIGKDPLAGYRLRPDVSAKDLIERAEFDRLKVMNDRELVTQLCHGNS